MVYLKKQSQFLKGQNDVSSLNTKDYDKLAWFGRPKNKANSKPISSVMRAFCQWCKRLPRPFGPRNDISISTPLCLNGFVAMILFEKTKPIC